MAMGPPRGALPGDHNEVSGVDSHMIQTPFDPPASLNRHHFGFLPRFQLGKRDAGSFRFRDRRGVGLLKIWVVLGRRFGHRVSETLG